MLYGEDVDRSFPPVVFNLESVPTEDETKKAPTSEWAYDLQQQVNALPTSDTNTQLFEGATRTALTQDDATPEVSNGGLYDCNATGALTITDFVDGSGDHSDFDEGDYFGLYMDSADVTLDFDQSTLEREGGGDYTGAASDYPLLIFIYSADETAWKCINLSPGMTSPTTISLDAIPVDTLVASELNDTSDPHTLTTSELMAHILSNSESTGADEWDFPARSEGWNFTFIIEAVQNVTLDPNGTEQWYLNGTQMAAGEAIVNEAPTIGESISCISTEDAVYCKSNDSDWAEDTP
jgi:hypothetical protein